MVTWPCLDTILDSIRWLGSFLSDLSIHVTRHAAALPGCQARNGDGDTICLSINSAQLGSRGTQGKEARVNV